MNLVKGDRRKATNYELGYKKKKKKGRKKRKSGSKGKKENVSLYKSNREQGKRESYTRPTAVRREKENSNVRSKIEKRGEKHGTKRKKRRK